MKSMELVRSSPGDFCFWRDEPSEGKWPPLSRESWRKHDGERYCLITPYANLYVTILTSPCLVVVSSSIVMLRRYIYDVAWVHWFCTMLLFRRCPTCKIAAANTGNQTKGIKSLDGCCLDRVSLLMLNHHESLPQWCPETVGECFKHQLQKGNKTTSINKGAWRNTSPIDPYR